MKEKKAIINSNDRNLRWCMQLGKIGVRESTGFRGNCEVLVNMEIH